MIILGVKYLPFKLLNRKYIFYLLAAMLMFAVCWGIRMSDLTDFVTIIIRQLSELLYMPVCCTLAKILLQWSLQLLYVLNCRNKYC